MLNYTLMLRWRAIMERITREYIPGDCIPGYRELWADRDRRFRDSQDAYDRIVNRLQQRDAFKALKAGDESEFLFLARQTHWRGGRNGIYWVDHPLLKGKRISECDYCSSYRILDTESGACAACERELTLTEDGIRMRRRDAFAHPDGRLYSYRFSYVGGYHSSAMRRDKVVYHYPNPKSPLAKDTLHLGFEYEYNAENREDDAKALADMPWCVCEEDGSLEADRGMEIVTGYSTLDTVKGWVDAMMKAVHVAHLVDAGLHVNISGMRSRARAKFIHFFSAPNTEALLRIVAGRYNTEYARVSNYRMYSLGHLWRDYVDGTYDEGSKYRHVKEHRGYLEVRVFSSFDKADRILAALELVWAVAKFCEQPGVKMDQHTFVNWCANTPWVRKHVPNLENRLSQSTLQFPVKKGKEKQCLQMALA